MDLTPEEKMIIYILLNDKLREGINSSFNIDSFYLLYKKFEKESK